MSNLSGPFSVRQDGADAELPWAVIGPDGTVISRCVDEALARFFAGGPDLLLAAQISLQRLATAAGVEDVTNPPPAFRRDHLVAYGAIASAQGRTTEPGPARLLTVIPTAAGVLEIVSSDPALIGVEFDILEYNHPSLDAPKYFVSERAGVEIPAPEQGGTES